MCNAASMILSPNYASILRLGRRETNFGSFLGQSWVIHWSFIGHFWVDFGSKLGSSWVNLMPHNDSVAKIATSHQSTLPLCLGKPLTTSIIWTKRRDVLRISILRISTKWRKSGNQADIMVADDHSSALRLSLFTKHLICIAICKRLTPVGNTNSL